MSKRLLKRVERLLRYPADYDFNELKLLLEDFGFRTNPPRRGSHWVFYLETPLPEVNYETDQITVPVVGGRKVKRIYLKTIARLFNLEEWYEKNKD